MSRFHRSLLLRIELIYPSRRKFDIVCLPYRTRKYILICLRPCLRYLLLVGPSSASGSLGLLGLFFGILRGSGNVGVREGRLVEMEVFPQILDTLVGEEVIMIAPVELFLKQSPKKQSVNEKLNNIRTLSGVT